MSFITLDILMPKMCLNPPWQRRKIRKNPGTAFVLRVPQREVGGDLAETRQEAPTGPRSKPHLCECLQRLPGATRALWSL